MVYFDTKGSDNTERTLQIAKDEALKRNIQHVVVASTRGQTGLQAAQLMRGFLFAASCDGAISRGPPAFLIQSLHNVYTTVTFP